MKLVSFSPIMLNGWKVQASILGNGNICLILYNVDFDMLFIRYFRDEIKAHQYMTNIVYGDADVSEEGEL